MAPFVDDLVATGQVTAAVAMVQRRDRLPEVAVAGRVDAVRVDADCVDADESERRVGPDGLFDLASLTKTLSGTLALVLDQSGDLPLATSLGEIWSAVDDRLARTTVEDLLRHRAGLRRWMPLYAVCSSPQELAPRLLDGQWVDATPPAYSDLDYLLWGLSVEHALGTTYAELLNQRVLTVLGSSEFSWSGGGEDRLVACCLPTGREVELAAAVGLQIDELPAPDRGRPQDGNCRFLGRPMGHAGMFGTASGLLALARAFLEPGSLLSTAAVDRALGGADRFATGWFRRSETAAGRVLGERAFGHEGFTGGSLWVDPDGGLMAVLLAHRASLTVDLSEARVGFHRLALGL